MSTKIYGMVTDHIIAELEKGIVPWRKPWQVNAAVNWKSKKPYRGINTLLLESGEYASFKQVSEAGGKVKKGEKGNNIVFWKWSESENEETGEIEKIPFIRYYTVFEINRQCEGLQSKRNDETFDHNPIKAAERICAGYMDAPPVSFASGRALYCSVNDIVTVPPLSDYAKSEEYYNTLFHEHIHSTGHAKRLNRPGVTELNKFGSESYSKEELVAEIGAAMLCGVAGIDNSIVENSAAYIGSWLRKLKADNKLIVQAAGQAQKAVDYILGTEFEESTT